MRNTKKFLSVLLAVLMIFSVAPLGGLEGVTASAVTYEGTCGADGDNVKWSFDDETGELKITGNGEMEDYNDSHPNPWYIYKDLIKTVTIEDGVTSIGDQAFDYCVSLESVEIGSSITSIGEFAFVDCESLESITIPDSVISIGDAAFYECSKLSSVEIGSGVTSIGGSAFFLCGSLESITIPDNVTSIGNRAFCLCKNLSRVEIGSGVKSIDDAAFYQCNSLTSVTIPDSVTSIGSSVFGECSKLSSVEIGSGVTSIGEQTFFNCVRLESITIPDGVTSIGLGAFGNCTGLERVTIPDSVTSIGLGAFGYCTGLKSATILNPECEINDSEYTFPEGTIIHGYANSTAQQYAEKYDLQFTEHKADSETVVRGATCTEAGLKEHKCTFCGEIVSTEEIPTKGEHTPREAVKEREIAATCSSAGSYDMVVYCDVCGEEISRVTYTTDKLQHTDNNDDGVCDECGNTIPVDTTGCDCVCHRVEKIPKVIYKILRAFWRLFKINKKCKCGTYHWIL